MNKKHILFLASWYPSEKSPFAGDFIQRHAQAVSTQNEVTVLYAVRIDSLKANYQIIQNGSNPKEIIIHYKGSWFRPFNYLKRLIALYKGHKLIGSYDLVHLNVTYPAGLFALLLKFFKNKKYVITEHWTNFRKDKFKKINPIERFFIRLILKNSEIILPVSNDLGKSMLEVVPVKKMEVIPNVVDTAIFHPKSSQTSNPVKKFLHLSSLKDKHKNISGMLRVAKKLAEEGYRFEFHIGGTGTPDFINQFNQENDLENIVFYFPALSYDKVPSKMKEFDCFVLFSNYENQPCVQGESFAAGLPFIGTDVGGVSEFLPENFGFLIEKENEEELYMAMKKVLEDHQFASKEEMNRYAIETFSPEVISKKFNIVYEKILHEKN